MKKLGLVLTLAALVAFVAVASASARGGTGAASSGSTPATGLHSADSGPGHGGDARGDDHGGHHGDDQHGDDHGDRREAGEDIRGNCDEAEHAGDASCAGVAAVSSSTTRSSSSADAGSGSGSGSGAGAGAGQSRAVAGKRLMATVGPGFSITLKTPAGVAVKTLRAGTYTVVVRDRSEKHNFHLSGRGVDKATSVGAVATQTWRVQFKAGTYAFTCDPHAQVMRGSLRVR
jgi:plastocyanin